MSDGFSDLLPCPFCGDGAGPEIGGDEFVGNGGEVTIFCNGCHASAATEHSYVAAVARWNARSYKHIAAGIDHASHGALKTALPYLEMAAGENLGTRDQQEAAADLEQARKAIAKYEAEGQP